MTKEELRQKFSTELHNFITVFKAKDCEYYGEGFPENMILSDEETNPELAKAFESQISIKRDKFSEEDEELVKKYQPESYLNKEWGLGASRLIDNDESLVDELILIIKSNLAGMLSILADNQKEVYIQTYPGLDITPPRDEQFKVIENKYNYVTYFRLRYKK